MKTNLTPRGRAFAAAGVGVLAVVVLLGERDLLPAVFVLVASPIFGALLVTMRRFTLAASRTIHPTRASIGTVVTVNLAITNLGNSTTGLLLMSEQLPRALGRYRQRFTVEALAPQATAPTQYELTPTRRGRFSIGPLHMWSTDPMGMASLHRSFSTVHQLLVTPPVIALAPIIGGSGARQGDSSISSSQRSTAAGEPETIVREYQQGDDVRKIHWRASASAGELMVRQDIRQPNTTAVVLLDNRATAHRGTGNDSSFEWAVTAAASISTHLQHQGYEVALVASDGTAVSEDPLAFLAEIGLIASRTLVTRPSRADVVVAITGLLTSDDLDPLARLAPRRSAGYALILNAETWIPRTERENASHRVPPQVAELGWSTRPVSLGDALGDVWRALGRHPQLVDSP